MKKSILLCTLLAFVFCCFVVFGICTTRKKNLETANKKLENLYYKQNTAFELSENLDDRNYFHGANELRRNRVVVNLFVYNNIQTAYKLTIDEVEKYLNEEYSSDGKPKIYSIPDNISDYISWYWNGGGKIILEFGDWFNDYLSNNDYPQHSYRKMNDVDVIDALELYSGDSDYVSPEECAMKCNG